MFLFIETITETIEEMCVSVNRNEYEKSIRYAKYRFSEEIRLK